MSDDNQEESVPEPPSNVPIGSDLGTESMSITDLKAKISEGDSAWSECLLNSTKAAIDIYIKQTPTQKKHNAL